MVDPFRQIVRRDVDREEARNRRLAIGIVKRVEPSQGSGLIASEDGREYYFHRTGIKRPLTFDDIFGGERVQFEIENNEQGPRAIEICKTSRN